MFKNNFVVAVKVNGKILREVEDIVYLPFGTEYSILLKNTSPQKAQVKIRIDGTDVTEGVHLIVDGNDTLELKRFIKNGNLNAGNAFKFIEKTEKIEQFRGNKAEDGLLTVEYEFARKPVPYLDYSTIRYRGIADFGDVYYSNSLGGSLQSTSASFTTTASTGEALASNSSSDESSDGSEKLRSRSPLRSASLMNTAGITAPGKVVEQSFQSVAGFLTDGVKHSITLQLKGKNAKEVAVKQPVTVKKVQRCTMCGTNNKQVAKFCHECGASLELV